MTPKYQQRLERTRTDDGWFAPRSEDYAGTYTGRRGDPTRRDAWLHIKMLDAWQSLANFLLASTTVRIY
jgi:hypothetical protein